MITLLNNPLFERTLLMNISLSLFLLMTFVVQSPSLGDDASGVVILEDDFNREEKDPSKEQVGNDWGTNSRSRAKGVKQVDLVDGAMHITRADVADHGVSVTHEVAFQDATIQLRFKLRAKDDLGINIADMKEKSVHAGHICMARIRTNRVEIVDLKTGRMNLKSREQRLAGKLSAKVKKEIDKKSKFFKVDLAVDQWHQLEVKIVGKTMTVSLDDKKIGEFQSEGIAHLTKSRLRLAVGKSAWVDDVKVVRLQ